MRADTLADIRLYTEVGLVPVRCGACGVDVGVKKNSSRHTSIQWTNEAVRRCQEFSSGTGDTCGGLPLGCGRLRQSIDAAVADGTIVVPGA